MSEATTRIRHIVKVADVIAEHPDADGHAGIVLAGAVYYLARKYGAALVADQLYQLGESYADQIVPKWTPPGRARP